MADLSKTPATKSTHNDEAAADSAKPIVVQGWVVGRVQGVSYRASMQRRAIELGVSGWVRNLADRRVAFLIKGSPTQVDALIDWARQGPRFARVDTIHTEPGDSWPSGQFQVLP